MRIQLWSYNFAPELVGIGPVSTTWAHTMAGRGHDVEVVAAHPHYPTREWGSRVLPYRETYDDVRVLRLPLWIGRGSVGARLRQEASYAAAQTLALPAVGRPDVLVSVSPSFPALAPAIVNARLRRIPWVLWIQDLLPDAAVNTDLLEPGRIVAAAHRLEMAAYRQAARIVLISERHRASLLRRGVPDEKLRVITNPSTLATSRRQFAPEHFDRPRVLCIGNIGLSQGLEAITRAFEGSDEMARRGVTLHFAGDGVRANAVRAEIRSDRTKILGIIPETLDAELTQATVGLVGQLPSAGEFNMPSRLMNLMAQGIPVVAVVSLSSEVARIVNESGGGWVLDAATPEEFPVQLARILDDPEDVCRRGDVAAAYALRNFTPEGVGAAFEQVLLEAVGTPAVGTPAVGPPAVGGERSDADQDEEMLGEQPRRTT